MTVQYRGVTFELQFVPLEKRFFARSKGYEMWITPEQVDDFQSRGIMTPIVSVPKSEHDPGVVLGWQCEVCSAKWERKPEVSKCASASCKRELCPTCFTNWYADSCDICDEVVCSDCWQGVDGAKVCKKAECAEKARKDHAESLEIAREQRNAEWSRNRRRSA